MKIIHEVVEGAVQSGLIDLEFKNILLVDNPITPILYCLPKIHKSLTQPRA